MARLKLFYRLMLRPMLREPVRMGLTILAVAIGVAVVLAIELAGSAAVGSFHSSLETLAGNYTLEIVGVGGVPDSVVRMVAAEPVPLQYSPPMEDYATITESKETQPLVGVDMIAEGSQYLAVDHAQTEANSNPIETSLKYLEQPTSVWVGSSLKKKVGDQIELLTNDQKRMCIVRGVYPDSNGNDSAIVMDLAGAERALKRSGRLDRILLKLPKNADSESWQKRN